MVNYSIIWDNEAKNGLKDIIAYIKIDSPKNAKMVKNSVFKFVDTLFVNPNSCTQLKNNKNLNITGFIL